MHLPMGGSVVPFTQTDTALTQRLDVNVKQ